MSAATVRVTSVRVGRVSSSGDGGAMIYIIYIFILYTKQYNMLVYLRVCDMYVRMPGHLYTYVPTYIPPH